ncbi:MAG: UDP binding domain-containing protein [Actinomycetota bacterium]|nr:UDP binding domain-containing protein [Actinomycetota bacterium]
MRFAVAGLTHLGVCMSIAAHKAGLDLVAFDSDSARVDAARRADFDAAEPGVVDFLRTTHERYLVTGEVDALADVDLVMIAIDTVLDEHGNNDDHEVTGLLEWLAAHLAPDVPIVIASQVRPGFTRAHEHLHPALYYFMETLIFGRGLERAMHPERYIVGRSSQGQALPSALQEYLDLPGCPVHVMSYESAELTKLSANYVLSATITAANSLADLAQRLGADWRDIEAALRDDHRIGEKAYITAGLGIGGANVTRDLFGIKDMSDRLGADSSFSASMLAHSAYMRDWVLRTITDVRRGTALERLAVLGLAYKPGTQSMRGGSGIDLVGTFESVLDVLVHDPAVTMPDRPDGSRAVQVRTAREGMEGAQMIAITTPWPEYRDGVEAFLASDPETILIDPYRLVDRGWAQSPRTRIIQLGVSDA